MIADVEPAIGYHRVSPGLFHWIRMLRLVRRRKTSFFAILLRGSFNEGDFAVLAVQIEMTVSKANRGRAQGALFPFDLACVEFDAPHRFGRGAVKKVANFHDAANGC